MSFHFLVNQLIRNGLFQEVPHTMNCACMYLQVSMVAADGPPHAPTHQLRRMDHFGHYWKNAVSLGRFSIRKHILHTTYYIKYITTLLRYYIPTVLHTTHYTLYTTHYILYTLYILYILYIVYIVYILYILYILFILYIPRILHTTYST